MDTQIVLTVLLLSIVNHVVFSANFQYIGECYYDDDNYAESNLTLICVKENRETTLFKPYDKTICSNQPVTTCKDRLSIDCQDGFYKFMVGRISFKNCALPKLPDKIFKIYDNVRTLNMSTLETESLQPENFIGSNYLTNLNASHNKIIEIPANLFVNSKKLIVIDFSFNQITQFHPHAFNNGNSLKYLNLSHNNISQLSVETFQKLIELKQLRIDYNQIAELPSFLFHKNEQLIEVDFSHNKIRKIDDFAFAGDFKLEKLNISHNQLKTFQKRFSDNHSNLKHLDISNNRINTLKPDTFDSLHDLLLLDLSNNFIKKLSNKTFDNLEKLQQLFLSRNNLSEISLGTFSSLIRLQVLDLSQNILKILDANVLPSQSSHLNLLAIADNQLHELNGFTSLRIPNTKIIGIDSNRFNCSFLDHLFQAITWKHLDSISIRIECNSGNESTENTTNKTTESVDFGENVTFSWIDESINLTEAKPYEKSEFSEENSTNVATKTISMLTAQKPMEKSAISTRRRNNQTQPMQSHMNNDFELMLLKKYLYILVCVIAVGFTITALLFTRLILHTQMLEKDSGITRTDFDVKYYVETVKPVEMPESINSTENHTYEVIEIAKSERSSTLK